MVVAKEQIESLIFKALRQLNEDLETEKKIKIHSDTPLFGVNAEIDSLSLVSVIVDIETELNSEFNLSISLTDDRAMTRAESPFLSVKTLLTYILELTAGEA